MSIKIELEDAVITLDDEVIGKLVHNSYNTPCGVKLKIFAHMNFCDDKRLVGYIEYTKENPGSTSAMFFIHK